MHASAASHDDLADANALESIRELARWQHPCEWTEEGGVLLVAGANESARGYRNCAARVNPKVSAAEVLERARAFFGRWRRQFAVCTRAERDADLEALLEREGFVQRSDAPSMWIDRPLGEVSVPDGIVVEPFTQPRHIEDSAAVTVEAYQALSVPPDEMRLYFAQPARLLSERVAGFVAYEGGEPLSTAITIMSGPSAGLYFVGTRKHAERRGLGELCTRLATNVGFARGAKLVTLQASPGGEPMYRKLGYRPYDRFRWYR